MDQQPPNFDVEKAQYNLEGRKSDVSRISTPKNDKTSTKTIEEPKKIEDDTQYPQGMKLILIMISLYFSMFLVALVGLSSSALLRLTYHLGSNNHIQRYPQNHG